MDDLNDGMMPNLDEGTGVMDFTAGYYWVTVEYPEKKLDRNGAPSVVIRFALDGRYEKAWDYFNCLKPEDVERLKQLLKDLEMPENGGFPLIELVEKKILAHLSRSEKSEFLDINSYRTSVDGIEVQNEEIPF